MPNITVKNDAPELMQIIPAMHHATQTWHCFKSPESLCEYLATIPESSYWTRSVVIEPSDFQFRQVKSRNEAFALCRDGWQEGARRVAAMRDKIAVNIPMRRQFTSYGVAGAIPNVPRFLAGNPMHMKRLADSRARQRPVITLINHMGGVAGVKAKCFVNKCAVVAAIVDAIEANGYSCHVIGMAQSQCHNETYLCGVAATVKEAGDSVDIGRMAFALGHAAMFRGLVFGVRASDSINRPLGDMGWTVDFNGQNETANSYILPSMNTNSKLFETEELASTRGLAYFLDMLKAQGCPAFDNREAA